MGRQPLFRPGGINHEIGKLPQQIVDRIPLVMYIPSPPPKDANSKDLVKDSTHTYPPAPSDSPVEPTIAKEPASPLAENLPPAQRRHRFFFLRRSRKEQKPDLEGGGVEDAGDRAAKLLGKMRRKPTEDEWEANWERGEYPFVKLPDNRATCAICLLDFEAPPRRGAAASANAAAATASGAVSTSTARSAKGDSGTTTVPVEPLSLQDAGEGATPLRLLACGHAFHQTCLDPWLKDVSGRCPVCQKKVDIEELEKLSKKGKSTSWATNVVTSPAEPASPTANVSDTAGQSHTQ